MGVTYERVDPVNVRVDNGAEARVLPLAVAARLWMAGAPENPTRPATDRFVCFSAVRPDDGTPDPFVYFAHAERYGPVWPEWLTPEPEHAWGRCRLGAWVRTTDLCEVPAPAVDTPATAPPAAGIDERCREIQRQGEDEHYLESLDHYVTLRVKHAYLRLNGTNLEGRLAEVRACLRRTLAVLRDPRLADWAAAWEYTEPENAADIPGVAADPNHLCTPLRADFDLPGSPHDEAPHVEALAGRVHGAGGAEDGGARARRRRDRGGGHLGERQELGPQLAHTETLEEELEDDVQDEETQDDRAHDP